MAHPYLEQLQILVRNIDRGDVELVSKHFFSGAALYADGKICASLTPAGLAFKLSQQRCDVTRLSFGRQHGRGDDREITIGADPLTERKMEIHADTAIVEES